MTGAAGATKADLHPSALADWGAEIRAELEQNILPFWPRHLMDRQNGGFFGTVHADLTVERDAPRGAVLAARILWTYSAATRLVGPQWRETADWALADLLSRFWDKEQGGIYWMLDAKGAALSPRKQTYAQAFAIYGLAEYHRATGSAEALERAIALYRLVERHCYDPRAKGYFEARDRAWQTLDDVRLSDKDLNAPKSMNTHLHVLEAYTNLLRVWPDPGLKARQAELLGVMMDHIVDTQRGHFHLFFDEDWKVIGQHVSFGHDIEGSWLIYEAAEVLANPLLLQRARRVAIGMAEACFAEGLDKDGSMFFDAGADGRISDATKHWWVQAETVIGFLNAYEITTDVRFLDAARCAWDYIAKHVVDHVHGEWHAKLSREGVALTEAEDPDAVLAGPWKCPYHNARLCYEVTERLGRSENCTP